MMYQQIKLNHEVRGVLNFKTISVTSCSSILIDIYISPAGGEGWSKFWAHIPKWRLQLQSVSIQSFLPSIEFQNSFLSPWAFVNFSKLMSIHWRWVWTSTSDAMVWGITSNVLNSSSDRYIPYFEHNQVNTLINCNTSHQNNCYPLKLVFNQIEGFRRLSRNVFPSNPYFVLSFNPFQVIQLRTNTLFRSRSIENLRKTTSSRADCKDCIARNPKRSNNIIPNEFVSKLFEICFIRNLICQWISPSGCAWMSAEQIHIIGTRIKYWNNVLIIIFM